MFKKIFITLTLLFIFTMPVFAQAAQICTTTNSLTFTAPSTNTDLSPLTDLAGFKLYFSNTSGTEGTGTVKDVAMDGATGPGTAGTIALNSLGLVDGKIYFFKLSAYDTLGGESNLSNEVTCAYDITIPNAPGNIIIK